MHFVSCLYTRRRLECIIFRLYGLHVTCSSPHTSSLVYLPHRVRQNNNVQQHNINTIVLQIDSPEVCEEWERERARSAASAMREGGILVLWWLSKQAMSVKITRKVEMILLLRLQVLRFNRHSARRSNNNVRLDLHLIALVHVLKIRETFRCVCHGAFCGKYRREKWEFHTLTDFNRSIFLLYAHKIDKKRNSLPKNTSAFPINCARQFSLHPIRWYDREIATESRKKILMNKIPRTCSVSETNFVILSRYSLPALHEIASHQIIWNVHACCTYSLSAAIANNVENVTLIVPNNFERVETHFLSTLTQTRTNWMYLFLSLLYLLLLSRIVYSLPSPARFNLVLGPKASNLYMFSLICLRTSPYQITYSALNGIIGATVCSGDRKTTKHVRTTENVRH